MAPAKATAAAKGAFAQRSISSFFGAKPASGTSAKKKSPKKSHQKTQIEILSIPSGGGETRLQSPPSKQAGVGSIKKIRSRDDDAKSLPTSSPISPDSTKRKNDEVTKLIKPRGVLTEATERAVKDHTRQPLINLLAPGHEFWDAQRSREEIFEIFSSFNSSTKPSSGKGSKKKTSDNDAEQLQMLPKALRLLVEAGSRGEAALSALGGCIFYLREALLDKTVLRLGRIELLPGSHGLSTAEGSAERSNEEGSEEVPEGRDGLPSGNKEMLSELCGPYMTLDSAALENLEIIENNRDGGTSGSHLSARMAQLTQGFIDSSLKAMSQAEASFQTRLEREKTKKRKRREVERGEGILPPVVEAVSPRQEEKSLRKKARHAEKKRRAEERLKAEERARRPKLNLNAGGAPMPCSYSLFRRQLGSVVRSHFGHMDYWGKKGEDEKHRIREQVKDRFSNGSFIDDRFLNKKISLSLADKRNHIREKMRRYLADCNLNVEVIRKSGCPGEIPEDAWMAWLDEELQVRAWQARRQLQGKIHDAAEEPKPTEVEQVQYVSFLQRKLKLWEDNCEILGEPPASLVKALLRVEKRAAITHRMGQGGSQRLKAQFEREHGRPISPKEREMAKKLGTQALQIHMDK